MTEPEFVLVEEPLPVAGVPQARPLKRVGRRGVRKSVLIPIDGHRPHRGLLVLAIVALGLGAAAFVVVKRRAAQRQDVPPTALLEDDDEALAMREPPISAV